MKFFLLIFIFFQISAFAQPARSQSEYESDSVSTQKYSPDEAMQQQDPGSHPFHVHRIGSSGPICYGPPYDHMCGYPPPYCFYSDPVPCNQ